jgi:hypothetical protein
VARLDIKKNLEVNAWGKKTCDRDLWSKITRKAKAHKGLQCQRTIREIKLKTTKNIDKNKINMNGTYLKG